MDIDPNGIRRQNPLGPAKTFSASNDAPGLFNTPFTRDSNQKTRLETLNFQATGQAVSGLGTTVSPARPDSLVIPGLGGFTRSRGPVSLPQAPQPSAATPVFSLSNSRLDGAPSIISNASNILFPISRDDAVSVGRQDLLQPKPPQQSLPSAGFPFNNAVRAQNTQIQKKISTRPPSKVATSKSSTLAQGVSQPDLNPSSVDFQTFQSILTAQRRNEELLKEKEGRLLRSEQEINVLCKKNLELAAQLERTKEKSKAYIQQCDKILRSTQAEFETFQASSREAYARCIEDVQSNLPDLETIKSDLTERMQNIEYQLDEEHQHRARIGPDLFYQLETAKHQADVLRDKLIAANEDLVDAKLRVQELESCSNKEKASASQALKLLEDTRNDLEIARQSVAQNHQIHTEELEQQLEEVSRVTETQISDLQKLNQALTDTIRTKEDGISKLRMDMDRLAYEMKTLETLPAELAKARDLVAEKDRQLTVLETQQAAERLRTEELAEQVKKNENVKTKLDDQVLRSATLESQYKEHLVSCAEQKSRIQQLQQDLAHTQTRYSGAQLEVKRLQDRHELLESGHQDLRATSNATKKELIDTQTKLEEAQKDVKRKQRLMEEQSGKAEAERMGFQGLLENNTQDLKQARNDLVQAKKEHLEVVAAYDVEKNGLKVHLAETQKHASTEKARLENAIVSLKRDLQDSVAIAKELKSTVANQKVEMDETAEKIKSLSSEMAEVSKELEVSRAKYQELSTSFTKLETANDREVQLHLQEKTTLEARVHETENNLILSREALAKAQLQVQHLGNQITELTRAVEEKAFELKAANERWLIMENKMDHLTANLSEAKSSIQNGVKLTSTLVAAQETNMDVATLDALNSQVLGLQEQLKVARDRNMALEGVSRTLLDRHKRHELTEDESALVKLVASSTMQVHEKERIQTANDLKRRDATIQALGKRVKELEKQLAGRLEKKKQSPREQLMTMKDVLHSSPLSVIEEGDTLMQQRMAGAATTNQSTFSRPPPSDQPGARGRLQKMAASNHAGTFAKLNQASSDDVEDDDTIRQFLDHRMDETADMQDYSAPFKTRMMKRGRDEEVQAPIPTGGKGVGARATRKRKLSAGAVAVDAEGGVEAGFGRAARKVGAGVDEERSMGGTEVDGVPGAAAKYKAAQRGKLRR